jgi:hypothetical protein
MTSDIKRIDNHWQQTTSEFRAYLQRTIELLARKQEITKVDEPLLRNPRKATSRYQTQVIPEAKHSNPVPIVPADKERVAFKPASARLYTSPLWVGLGDEDEGPSRSNRKTKYKKKAK